MIILSILFMILIQRHFWLWIHFCSSYFQRSRNQQAWTDSRFIDLPTKKWRHFWEQMLSFQFGCFWYFLFFTMQHLWNSIFYLLFSFLSLVKILAMPFDYLNKSFTLNLHHPSGSSPQKWTDIKGHSTKSVWSSSQTSFGLQ